MNLLRSQGWYEFTGITPRYEFTGNHAMYEFTVTYNT